MQVAMMGFRGVPSTYGGVERHAEELGVRLVERGVEVTVFNRSDVMPGVKEYRGLHIIHLPFVRQKVLEMASHTCLSTLCSWFKPFDIIHYQSVDPALFAPWGRVKAKVVATSHGQAYRRAKWGKIAKSMSMQAEKVFVNWTDARISVSKTLKAYYEEKYKKPVTYVPNGVNIYPRVKTGALDRLSIAPQSYILWSGRLEPTKGCHTALEAYRKAERREPFIVMGGSTYTDDYIARLKSEFESDRVRFIGHRSGDDFWEILQNAKLFVFPSEIEGLSIALLEAMSQKLPIVFSDIPENMEVADGVGLSFRVGDVNDLAEKMVQCLDNRTLAGSLGEMAGDRVKREYNWEAVTDATLAVYEQVGSI